ncbi:MAG TPA: TonB-dependent receptor [Terriglobia bacterium]|nr:TonB-dependent receptor [Terriglobia bacterium]
MRSLLKVLCLVLVLAFGAMQQKAWAQGAVGTLNGTVMDPSGAVVPGATVIATNTATGVASKTTTTSAGAYTLPYLPYGTYSIRASAPGFQTAENSNIILRVAQVLTVNMRLSVGQVTQQVEVSSTPELLETGSAEIGRYITAQEYKAWPIMVDDGQRQIQEFIFDSLPGTQGSTFAGTINGGQAYSHEILIDGIPVGRSDLSGGNNNEFSPSAEAIGEFKLQEGAMSAQYNGGQTAVANFTIKSGTNALHGSAFYYNQNEALGALDLQTKTAGGKKSKNRLNNYGYSLGGPVVIPKIYNGHDKTFFFTNFEHDSVNSLGARGFGTLAATEYRAGDFSGLLDPNWTGQSKPCATSGQQVCTIDPVTGAKTYAFDALGRPIIFGQIYDPRTTRTVNGQAVRDPFPGNIIDPSAFDPAAANIVNKVGIVNPQYDKMINNITRIGGSPFFDEHIIGIKIDHTINEKNRLSGYWNRSYRNRQNNGGTPFLPFPGPLTQSWQQQTTPGYMGRFSWTTTITPSLLNRAALGYNGFTNNNGALPSTVNNGCAATEGLQNLPDTMCPVFRFSGAEYQGGTIARMGVGFVDFSENGSEVLADDATWIKGAHTFKFGYQYSRYFYNDNSLSDAGSFTFTPRATDAPGFDASTGHAFASFLLGGANNASHGISGISSAFRQPYHELYFSDDWRATPRLSLNFGLRWGIIPSFFERTGRMSEVDLTAPNPGADNRKGALVFESRVNDTYYGLIGPRFGLAYQLSNKIVIRTGYAITNTPPIANGWGYSGFLNGFNGTNNVVGGTSPTGFVDDPAIYLGNPYPSFTGTLPNTDPTQLNYQSNVITTAKDANRPTYVQNWEFTVQYLLPKETVLEVAYVGNKGTRDWGGQSFESYTGLGWSEYDGLPSSLLSMGDILTEQVGAHPQFLPYASFPTNLTVAQAMRPYPQYFGVDENFPYNTNSNYHSLQITATKHLTKGLGFLAAYTWSKAIGYVDANGPGAYYATMQDYKNRSLERSVTAFNIPSDFKLTWVYQTPVGKGREFDLHWANPILGGWQLSAIQHYSSGSSVQVSEGNLLIPDGIAGGIRPDVTGQKLTLGGAASNVDVNNPTPYINPAAFSLVPQTGNGVPLRVGSAPRFLTNLRGPASPGETFRLEKKFPFTKREGTFFGLGMTMTNPFNRHNAYISSTDVTSSQFGGLLAGGGGRTVQLDGRIEF